MHLHFTKIIYMFNSSAWNIPELPE
uniref:Uncharacterized protein n=1 Tax=Arundo donax TaxID=35708 RepID=A0A0A8YU85_ARUDO